MTAYDMDASNLAFVEELLQQWVESPESVPQDWRRTFEGLEREQVSHSPATASGSVSGSDATAAEQVYKQSRVNALLWAYRDVGYLHAQLNPLRGYVTPGMQSLRDSVGGDYRDLSLEEFDLSEADLNKEYSAGQYMVPRRGTLREIIRAAKETYCSSMGVEFLHIQNREMRNWIIENIEQDNNRPDWSAERKRKIQIDLIRAEEFERFLHGNFIGQKRFSLEGSESLLPALRYLIDRAAYEAGLEEVLFGMTHRGRLNILVNLMRQPAASIFATFSEEEVAFRYTGSGDVRYHLGFSTEVKNPDGTRVHVGLVANPSHLEAVSPVVQGKCRGIQRRRGDHDRKTVLPILIHGDSALSGQGIVAETLNLSQLRGYKTGGTIHIVVNNQIGFTTASRDARSTFFPTDIAKSMPIPIFHANGDSPETVVRAIDLAFRYRQKFAYDAVVDIFCYRKYGHSEADDPTFTHPVMYDMIGDLSSVATQYGDTLNKEGVFSFEEQKEVRDDYLAELTLAVESPETQRSARTDAAFQSDEWRGFTREYDHSPVKTAVTPERLERIAGKLCEVPESIRINPKLRRIINERKKRFNDGIRIDWASAEALAFGTLLADGIPIRLSGEDSARGTFSQRHAIWWSSENGSPKPYCPYDFISEDQARFTAYDSPLSEFSVLGFEYGNALAQPNMLTIWEAQFGDFANGAQVIIDEFVSSADTKWDRSNGLVMLLPHGYSGQGPDHSSGYLERYLQLCAEDNMQVCNMTTPVQYFHVLRRQMMRNFRKPLIIMAPKQMLRHKFAISALDEFTTGHFLEVLDDAEAPDTAETLIFCSGQVYYDLIAERKERKAQNTAIIRIEQLYPFAEKQLKAVLKRYRKANDLVWVQEEPRNRGAWTFINDQIGSVIGKQTIRYVGRKASSSPATGSQVEHKRQLEAFLDEAFEKARVLRKVG
jgi:2-oxoglutarate dehydrogenase E1 component